MGKSVNKKNLLFIGVGFQQYNDYLVDYLSKEYNLWHYGTGEFKAEHSIFMLWARYFPSEIRKTYRECLLRYIEKTKDCNFDYILVLKGTHMTDEHLELLKQYHPDSKYVLYLWDSLERMDNGDVLMRHFKSIASFDSEDCKKYGFKLRPLFYIESGLSNDYSYDVSFIGNNHSDRIKLTLELKAFCKENKLSYKFVIPVGGKTYFKAKCQNNYYLYGNTDIIRAKSISYREYLAITKASKVVIDIPSPLQSGLSIRTIEALAMGSRVITTNTHIKEYENIPQDTYFIWNRQYDQALLEFIRSPKKNTIIDKYYAIESFIDDLLKE